MMISEPYFFSCCDCHVRAFLSGCHDHVNPSQGALPLPAPSQTETVQNLLLLLSCVRLNITRSTLVYSGFELEGPSVVEPEYKSTT
jgi:hypothetical protein